MSNDDTLFPVPDAVADTLSALRFKVGYAQGAAVAALRKCDEVSGEDNGADDLDKCFLKADDVQRDLLVFLREWQQRDEADFSDEDGWSHPEGPLSRDELAMMKAFEIANKHLNDLRMAIAALRARELAELHSAGASIGELPRA